MHWFLKTFLTYLLLSYPLNFAMMYNNVGLYDTPTKMWASSRNPDQKASDAQGRRTFCFAVSPIFAPISGLYLLTDITIPEEY